MELEPMEPMDRSSTSAGRLDWSLGLNNLELKSFVVQVGEHLGLVLRQPWRNMSEDIGGMNRHRMNRHYNRGRDTVLGHAQDGITGLELGDNGTRLELDLD